MRPQNTVKLAGNCLRASSIDPDISSKPSQIEELYPADAGARLRFAGISDVLEPRLFNAFFRCLERKGLVPGVEFPAHFI